MTTRLPVLSALLLAGVAAGQTATPSNVVTRSLEPAADDLARLNLVVSWRLYLPVEGREDAVATVQPADDQVYVQLRSGKVVAIQADNNPKTFKRAGDVLWTYRPERPPGLIQPLAVGPGEVYVVHGQHLLILDRADGKVKYSEEMASTAAAGPAADNYSIYIPLDNRRIVSYSHEIKVPGYRPPKPYEAPDPVPRVTLAPEPADALSTPQNRSPSIARLEILRPPFRRGTDTIDSSPSVGMLRTLKPPYREAEATRSPSVGMVHNLREVHELTDKTAPTRIKFLWTMLVGGRLTDTPLLTYDPTDPLSDRLLGYTGRAVFTARRDADRTNTPVTEYVAEAEVTAPLTAHGDSLYVATADTNFVSLSVRELAEPSLVNSTLPRGKFTTGGVVEQRPLLTEEYLYVVGARWGLIKLRRGSLEPAWTERLPDGRVRPRPNGDVARVLAVNGSYVYGLDRRGRLLVIDTVRGSTLSAYDISGFTVPVTNEVNDRLYVAANSGLLLCLRDRLRVKPEITRKPAPVPSKADDVYVDPKAAPKAAPKADPEMKKEPAPKKE